ncbi:serine O-acetyltransferase [Enterococcus mundtii]|uniref:Serine acetyltransferase n=1 Tax=Enterococcus mundtii TaxID=53346 RepID=A0A2S7RP71_ENTMU|nr:serine acetyltransferase [Enterococcus mundtii]PQF21038.1 serine acetyltransferase [Enterococcus mundtii]
MRRKAERWADKACRQYRNGHKKMARLSCYILRVIYSCEFSEEVDFSSSAQLVHNGLGCVFHPKTKVGKNCKIYQNVTLGGNGKIIDGKVTKGGPILEENVAVFTGACVLGPIKIGHDSVIGANTVITRDVPPHSLVYGNPAKITDLKFKYKFD